MSNTGGKISAPVDTYDVSKVLGVASDDIGYLCSNVHKKTQPWSKKKPTIYPDLGIASDYWRAEDGMCGFNIPTYTSFGTISSGFLYDLMRGAAIWTYKPPYGGNAAPYRLLDWDGYNHYAIEPVAAAVPPSVYLDSSGNVSFQIEITTVDSTNLTLADFTKNGTQLSKYYIGMVLVQGSSYIVATTIDSYTFTITFSNMQSYTGTWKVNFFLCSSKIVQGGSIPAGTYIPLYFNPQTVTIYGSGSLYNVTAIGAWNYNNTVVTYDLYLQNTSSSAITFSNVTTYLVRTTGSTKPANGEIVRTENVGSVFVSPKSTVHLSDYTFNYIKSSGYTFWLGARADGMVTTYNQIEDHA